MLRFSNKKSEIKRRGNEGEEERLSFNVWIKNVGRSKRVEARIVSLHKGAINFHVFLSPPPRATRNFCILQCQLDLTRSRTCWYHHEANGGNRFADWRIETAAYKNAVAFPSNDSFDFEEFSFEEFEFWINLEEKTKKRTFDWKDQR